MDNNNLYRVSLMLLLTLYSIFMFAHDSWDKEYISPNSEEKIFSIPLFNSSIGSIDYGEPVLLGYNEELSCISANFSAEFTRMWEKDVYGRGIWVLVCLSDSTDLEIKTSFDFDISSFLSVMIVDVSGKFIDPTSVHRANYNITLPPGEYEFYLVPLYGKFEGTPIIQEGITSIYNYGRYSVDPDFPVEAYFSLQGTNILDEGGEDEDSEGGTAPSEGDIADSNNFLLSTQYTYNIRSWTTGIKTTNVLEQKLAYTYGGNVSQYDWLVDHNERSYKYDYDNLSRLKAANYEGGGNFSTNYDYDKHGNILSIERKGLKVGGVYDTIDNLTFTYRGNQLMRIDDDIVSDVALENSQEFYDYSDGTEKNTYNLNGALTKDVNKGITDIQYNSLNLPMYMTIDNVGSNGGMIKGTIEYTYSASGVKLRTVHTDMAPTVKNIPMFSAGTFSDSREIKTTDYVGNKIYENEKLKRVLIDGGYIEFEDGDISTGKYFFYVTDHLGNNKAVVDVDGIVIQRTDYYPFGMVFADSEGQEKQPYKYNGKELDTQLRLNTYDYSARYMDSAIGRFTSIDPLAEKFYSWSPYVYCFNNPLKYTDPDGRHPALIPLIKGIVGGVVDISAQMTVYKATNSDATWSQAFSKVDWTSVGTSALTSAFLAPGMSTTAKVGVGTAIAVDAMVDVNTEEIRTSELIGGDKSVVESGIDIGGQLVPGKGTDALAKGVMKDAAHDFSKNTINRATKAEVRAGVKAVNSTAFKAAGQGVEVYGAGLMSGALKEGIGANTYTPTGGSKSSISNNSLAQPSDATRVAMYIIENKLKREP